MSKYNVLDNVRDKVLLYIVLKPIYIHLSLPLGIKQKRKRIIILIPFYEQTLNVYITKNKKKNHVLHFPSPLSKITVKYSSSTWFQVLPTLSCLPYECVQFAHSCVQNSSLVIPVQIRSGLLFLFLATLHTAIIRNSLATSQY